MRTKEQILEGEDERTFLTKCYLNPIIWFERVLGLELEDFHKEWINLIKEHDRLVISAPTGHGKTTIFGVGYPLWLAFFKKNSVSLVISKSIRTQSARVLEEIKSTIENNEILVSLKPDDWFGGWTKEKIDCSNGSKILYSSYSANVRGIQADYVFCDEVATYLDHVIYYRDVATRVISKKGKIAAVSTPLNTTDLLAQLLNNSEYHTKIYPAIIGKKTIWPKRFSYEYLMNKKKEIGDSHFERNYMVNPRAESENPIFPLKDIELCFDINRSFTTEVETGTCYIGVDLAIASGPRADYDCFTVVERVGDICVLKWAERNRGIPISAKTIRLKQLNELYKPVRIVIDESNIGHSIIEELRMEGLPVEAQAFNSLERSKLLGNLKVLIENKKLIFPRNKEDPYAMNFIDVLQEELIAFREVESSVTKIKHLTSEASHDDTVMCYDDQSEVLTKKGWKLFKDVDKDDLICSLNKNKIEYVNINKIIQSSHNGEMVRFAGEHVNLLVTPNHNMFVSLSKGANSYDDFKLVQADKLLGRHFRLKKNGIWEGREYKNIALPAMDNHSNWKVPIRELDMDNFLELLGFYISEGSGNKNRIHIAQLKKSKGWIPIKSCLDKLKINYKIVKDGFVINDTQLSSFIKHKVPGKSYEKYIPTEFLDLSINHLLHLFTALMLGDGYANRIYVTSSKRLADQFMELALKIGKSANLYYTDKYIGRKALNGIGRFRIYFISINRLKNEPRFNHHKKYGAICFKEHYRGKIYCLNLFKNHIMMVRRKGKMVWSGNSLAMACKGAGSRKVFMDYIASGS